MPLALIVTADAATHRGGAPARLGRHGRHATQLLRREAERLLPAEADLLVLVISEQTQQLGHMAGNA